MPRVFSVVATILLATVYLWTPSGASCAADPAATEVTHLQYAVSIKKPVSVRIVETVSADFVLYRLSDKTGKLLMAIYLGDHPDTSIGTEFNFIRSSSVIGGFPAESIRWSGKDGTFGGWTSIRLPAKGTDPSVAHLLFKNLTRAESRMIEDVIRSFEKDASPDRK